MQQIVTFLPRKTAQSCFCRECLISDHQRHHLAVNWKLISHFPTLYPSSRNFQTSGERMNHTITFPSKNNASFCSNNILFFVNNFVHDAFNVQHLWNICKKINEAHSDDGEQLQKREIRIHCAISHYLLLTLYTLYFLFPTQITFFLNIYKHNFHFKTLTWPRTPHNVPVINKCFVMFRRNTKFSSEKFKSSPFHAGKYVLIV